MKLIDIETEMLARIVRELITDYVNEPCYGTEIKMIDGITTLLKKLDQEDKEKRDRLLGERKSIGK